MTGLLHHLSLTLRLNFRSWQAVVYGYVVPIFFLVAFGVVFRSSKPPLINEMGQLLTITVLGGACFGMPTAMVAERERGVWRRYRLLPAATGGIILSAMIARFVLVLSAALLQILLARIFLKTPFPKHPAQMFVAFSFVTFSFLGLGLVIAMLAGTVPAVQALGQAVFLPLIMIGGVGIPLRRLPEFWQHVAGFFPGLYAVQALDACMKGKGLSEARFDLLSLTLIGLAACLAGAKLFRWDAGQKLAAPAKGWVAAAVGAWAVIGLTAERTGRLKAHPDAPPSGPLVALLPSGTPRTVVPTTGDAATRPSTGPDATPAAPPKPPAPWQQITDAQLQAVTYEDVPDDNGTVTPLAPNLDALDEDAKKRMDTFKDALADWAPGNAGDAGQRVRSLISAAAVADIDQDPQEAEIPYVVFERLKSTVARDDLMKALGWVILKPDEGTVVTTIKDLGVEGDVVEEQVRERTAWYAKKLLYRMLGKDKQEKLTK